MIVSLITEALKVRVILPDKTEMSETGVNILQENLYQQYHAHFTTILTAYHAEVLVLLSKIVFAFSNF